MGLFDTVHCNYPLPDCPDDLRQREWWQTKDLECDGWSEYTITPEGRLMEHVIKWQWVDDETRPLFGGYYEKVSETLRDMNFHGILNFYTLVGERYVPENFYDYNAKFTDGQIVSIERLPIEQQTAAAGDAAREGAG